MFLYNNSNFKSRRRLLRMDQTNAERKLWRLLRNKQIAGLKFFRQYSVGPYILDFYCPKRRLAVELDGNQHGEIDHRLYDQERTKYLAGHNVKVLRFWNDDINKNMAVVWEKVLLAVS